MEQRLSGPGEQGPGDRKLVEPLNGEEIANYLVYPKTNNPHFFLEMGGITHSPKGGLLPHWALSFWEKVATSGWEDSTLTFLCGGDASSDSDIQAVVSCCIFIHRYLHVISMSTVHHPTIFNSTLQGGLESPGAWGLSDIASTEMLPTW